MDPVPWVTVGVTIGVGVWVADRVAETDVVTPAET